MMKLSKETEMDDVGLPELSPTERMRCEMAAALAKFQVAIASDMSKYSAPSMRTQDPALVFQLAQLIATNYAALKVAGER